MQRSVSLIKSALVELTFNYDGQNAVLSVVSGNSAFSTKNVDEAISIYYKQVARLHARSLKVLEDKAKTWQNITGPSK